MSVIWMGFGESWGGGYLLPRKAVGRAPEVVVGAWPPALSVGTVAYPEKHGAIGVEALPDRHLAPFGVVAYADLVRPSCAQVVGDAGEDTARAFVDSMPEPRLYAQTRRCPTVWIIGHEL